jgi:hypothetical protein
MSKDRRIAPRKIYAMNGTSPKKPRIVTPSKLSECATPALQAVRHAFKRSRGSLNDCLQIEER